MELLEALTFTRDVRMVEWVLDIFCCSNVVSLAGKILGGKEAFAERPLLGFQ